MPRPCKCRRIGAQPVATYFKPAGIPLRDLEELGLPTDGLEALRLADLEGLKAEDAAVRMGISRHTFGRILTRARRVVAQALVQGLALRVEGRHYAIHEAETQQPSISEDPMSSKFLIAVPSDEPGGLTAVPSAHFGHCAAYTIAHVENGQIHDVTVQANEGHEHGNCLAPVEKLASMGVKILVAGGMGVRPLMAMRNAGMDVYFSAGLPTVGQVIEAFAANKLQPFGNESLCKGGCGHH